jgi:hypothetical protein
MPDTPSHGGDVRAQLVAKVDNLVEQLFDVLDEVKETTEQLHPERARS